MNREELFDLIDIETPDDFQYFENFAALIECDEDLNYEDVACIVAGADLDTLAGIMDDYFEEITNFIPGGETEMFTLLENVRKSLVGMARNIEDETMVTKLSEEIDRFRKYYSMESTVYCTDLSDMSEVTVSLRDALTNVRAEKFGGTKYEYDFTECCDYKLEEYIMSFGDMITLTEREDEIDKAQEEIERNILGQL